MESSLLAAGRWTRPPAPRDKRRWIESAGTGRCDHVGQRCCLLRQFDIVGEPKLTGKPVAKPDPVAETLLLLPVRFRQMLSALDDQGGAFAAFAHTAAVQ